MEGLLSQAGVPGDEYIFYDGASLWRQSLITTKAVVTLLQYAAKQPWGRTYSETFPVAGVDGSLADRLRATPAQGLVLAKTGSHHHVKSLSGYDTTTSGDRAASSIFSNSFDAPGR